MEMYIIIALIGAYNVIGSMLLNVATNFSSRLVFKVMPFVTGLFLILYSFKGLNII